MKNRGVGYLPTSWCFNYTSSSSDTHVRPQKPAAPLEFRRGLNFIASSRAESHFAELTLSPLASAHSLQSRCRVLNDAQPSTFLTRRPPSIRSWSHFPTASPS